MQYTRVDQIDPEVVYQMLRMLSAASVICGLICAAALVFCHWLDAKAVSMSAKRSIRKRLSDSRLRSKDYEEAVAKVKARKRVEGDEQ